MPLFQRGLQHNLRLGVALGEAGIYAKITLDAPRRIDGNHEECFLVANPRFELGTNGL